MSIYISITTYILILYTHLTLTTNPHQSQNCYSMLLVSIICKMFFIMLYVRVMCSCHSCSVYRVIHVSCVRVIHVLFIVSFMCHVFVSNNVIYVSFICSIYMLRLLLIYNYSLIRMSYRLLIVQVMTVQP